MPTMPAKLTKGTILGKLDDWFNAVDNQAETPAVRAGRAVVALEADSSLETVLTNLVPTIPLTPGEIKHLKMDWLDSVNGWWPSLQPIEPILHRGILEACELAKQGGNGQGRPIDCYWICIGDEFEVYVTEGSMDIKESRQINLIVSTPSPPAAADLVAPKTLEPILIVSRAMSYGGRADGKGFDSDTGILTERPRVA